MLLWCNGACNSFGCPWLDYWKPTIKERIFISLASLAFLCLLVSVALQWRHRTLGASDGQKNVFLGVGAKVKKCDSRAESASSITPVQTTMIILQWLLAITELDFAPSKHGAYYLESVECISCVCILEGGRLGNASPLSPLGRHYCYYN